jgi:hypothetical protein
MEGKRMRKRTYTRNVGVLLSEDIYQLLVDVTDMKEVTISEFIRDLLKDQLNLIQKETKKDE